MSLLYPAMLAAAAAVVVPILVHLFGRPRPRLTRFPSLMLLQGVQRQRHTRTRVRRIFALILRCIALLLLAVMLARPLTAGGPLAALGDRQGASAIVVDASPSMAAPLDDGTSPWERAREAADALAEALGPAGGVIPAQAGTGLRLMAGSDPLEASDARIALAGLGVSDERARIDLALEELAAADEELARVFVISDLQETSLGRMASAVLRARVTLIDTGEEIRGNAALVGAISEGAVPLLRRPMGLRVTARAWGESEGRVPVTVALPGGDISAGIDLVPGDESVAVIEFAPSAAGPLVTEVTLPSDQATVGARHVFATLVRDRLSVGLIGDAGSTRFIHAALNPYSEADTRSTVAVRKIFSAADLLAGDFDAAVVTSPALVDDELGGALVAAASRGMGLLVYSAEPPRALLDRLGLGALRLGEMRTVPDGARLAEMVTNRPPLSGFAEPGAGDVSAASFRQVRSVEVTGEASVTVLARLDDGTPMLLEGAHGAGRVLLFATAPDDSVSDLVRTPEFVPLMHRMVTYLAAGRGPQIIAAPPGETTVVGLPQEPVDPRILGPHGEEVAHEAVDGTLRFHAATVGGYRVAEGEEDIAAFAVNLDPAEADPTRVSHDEAGRRIAALGVEVVAWERFEELVASIRPGEADISTLLAFLALLVLAVEAVQSLQPGAVSGGRDER